MQLTTNQINEIAKTVADNLSDLGETVVNELALNLINEEAEEINECESLEEVIEFVQDLVSEQYADEYF